VGLVTVLVPCLKTRQTTRFGEVRILADLQVLLETPLEESVKYSNSKVATPSFLQTVEWWIPKCKRLRLVPRFVTVIINGRISKQVELWDLYRIKQRVFG